MPFPLFPEQASSVAGQVDALYFTLIALALFFSLLIVIFVVYFIIKYRRGSKVSRRDPVEQSTRLEIFWSVIPLVLSLGIFAWGANLYVDLHEAPPDSLEIYVVGKQWMWKFQHPEGQREIAELHVPIDRPVKLVMTSQDVIHSFFIPAFRVKQDVLPGRFTTLWFEATKAGDYHLFCSEFCGTSHAEMGGRVIAMEPAQYEQWLAGALTTDQALTAAMPPAPGSPQSLAASGETLFRSLGCSGCHLADGSGAGPSLIGLYGNPVPLNDGGTVIADEQYIHDSILLPQKQIVANYPALMPTYQGQIGEDQVVQLVAYIKALAGPQSVDSGATQQQERADQGVEIRGELPFTTTAVVTTTVTFSPSIVSTSTEATPEK